LIWHRDYLEGKRSISFSGNYPLFSETVPYVDFIKQMMDFGVLLESSQPGHTTSGSGRTCEFGLSYLSGFCNKTAIEKLKNCGSRYVILIDNCLVYDCGSQHLLNSKENSYINVLGGNRCEVCQVSDSNWREELDFYRNSEYRDFSLTTGISRHLDKALKAHYPISFVLVSKRYGQHPIFRDAMKALSSSVCVIVVNYLHYRA
jgi:hypothetical protein